MDRAKQTWCLLLTTMLALSAGCGDDDGSSAPGDDAGTVMGTDTLADCASPY